MVKKILQSFIFAFQGLSYCFKSQLNMKIHFFIALVALFLSFWLKLSRDEFLFILLAIFLVWMTEIINTSIEKVVDIAAPQYHPLAKIAKNAAAGAVLVAAFFAIIIGVLIFGEKLLNF